MEGSRRSALAAALGLLVALGPILAPPGPVRAQGKPDFVEDELLVAFTPPAAEAAQAAAHGQAGAQVVREVAGLGVKVVKVPPARLEAAKQLYERNRLVEYVERNPIARPQWTPGDASFGQQWALNNSGQEGAKADADIDAPAAWDVKAPAGARAATISVVDTGLDAGHEDLAGKVAEQRNWYDGGGTGDGFGHGTHVAGIAAAKTDNGAGIAGVCPECQLLNAKACSDTGDCPHDRIANGVLWSVGCEYRERDAGGKLGKCLGPVRAQVINISLAGPAGSTTLQRAMDRASELGATTTCAAGNGGTNAATYPAFYTTCIAVAGTTSQDQKISWSNYGTWVDVAAPGDGILSALAGGGYGLKSGTSMAAPHAAGLAGLLRSRGVATTRDAVRTRIEGTADDIGNRGTYWAKGRINACRAMTNAKAC